MSFLVPYEPTQRDADTSGGPDAPQPFRKKQEGRPLFPLLPTLASHVPVDHNYWARDQYTFEL